MVAHAAAERGLQPLLEGEAERRLGVAALDRRPSVHGVGVGGLLAVRLVDQHATLGDLKSAETIFTF